MPAVNRPPANRGKPTCTHSRIVFQAAVRRQRPSTRASHGDRPPERRRRTTWNININLIYKHNTPTASPARRRDEKGRGAWRRRRPTTARDVQNDTDRPRLASRRHGTFTNSRRGRTVATIRPCVRPVLSERIIQNFSAGPAYRTDPPAATRV